MSVVTPPIVMDTNVLVAGACRHESSLAYQILMAVLLRRVPLMLTEGIIAEYEDVLSRLSVRRLTGLTPTQNGELVLDLIALSRQTQRPPNTKPFDALDARYAAKNRLEPTWTAPLSG